MSYTEYKKSLSFNAWGGGSKFNPTNAPKSGNPKSYVQVKLSYLKSHFDSKLVGNHWELIANFFDTYFLFLEALTVTFNFNF